MIWVTCICLFIISGCSQNNNQKTESTDLFQYKNSYVGDNSVVGHILNGLPLSESLTSFELATEEEPYGILIQYNPSSVNPTTSEGFMELVYNATYLITLIQNADWVQYNIGDQTLRITREQLNEFYYNDLQNFNSTSSLEGLISLNISRITKLKDVIEPD